MNKEFKPGQIWLDTNGNQINAHGGGILKYENTYYWYGEHKIDGELGNHAWVGIHVYSSTDLYNWKDEGLAFSIDENLNEDIVPNCIIERPKVLYCRKTGKFVMWFHYERGRRPGITSQLGAASGVAVSDSPVSGFKLLHIIRPNKKKWPVNVDKRLQDTDLIAKTKDVYRTLRHDENELTPQCSVLGMEFEEGQQARDFTLFLDDDGQAYHIYSAEHNSTTHIALLAEDFTTHSGEYHRAFPNRWMEAPCIFKRNKKYYFIGSGCTSWEPNAARSAVADHIYGPWTELGNPAGDANHADRTFQSQSTYVLQLEDTYIYMGDRWHPQNAIDGRYVWLPITFTNEKPILNWLPQWQL